MELTKKEKNLLIILGAVAFFAIVYFFVFQPQIEKASQLQVENQQLKARIAELNQRAEQQVFYQEETEAMKKEIVSYEKKFPSDVKEEDGIALALNLEDQYGIDISNLSFGERELITEDVFKTENVDLYRVMNSYEYQTDYKGLKQMIRYLQSEKENSSIDSLAVTFDSGSGFLSGTVNLNLFYLTGTERSYEEPDIPGVGLGVSDPFKALKKEDK